MCIRDSSNDAELEQEKLQDAQRGADEAMEMITKTLSEATSRRAEVHELQREVKEKEEHTMNRQGEIKNELSSIQPVLETAKAAVGQIKAEHLNEIRSLKMPPEPIADVLGAVLKLLGISDVSWTSMKKFLGNRGVKDEILNYDARRIGGEMRKDVARLLKQKASSFDQAAITRVSVAAAPLAAWVKANIRYSVVLEKIRPLESELSQAEDSLAKCNHRLQRCEEEILSIDNRVTALKSKFGEHTREAEKLRARLMMAEGTLAKAQNLLAKLSDEQARWQDQVKELRLELAALPRQLLLAAGFLTYLPRCPEDAREAALVEEIVKSLPGATTGKVGLPQFLAMMEAQRFLCAETGRYWVALSLREAESLRGCLHVALDNDAPLVPGARCAVALRLQRVMIDARGAAQLDGSVEAFPPPPRPQLLSAVQGFRFVDSQLAYTCLLYTSPSPRDRG